VVLIADNFHTLALHGERENFVIPDELAAGGRDLGDDPYVRNIAGERGGMAICLTDAAAAAWQNDRTGKTVNVILRHLLPHNTVEQGAGNRSNSGRPEKLRQVIQAYEDIGLSGKCLTRKEELRLLGEHLDMTVSVTTLYRALRKLGGTSSGDDDGTADV